MMTRKKKIKIAKQLAKMQYVVETDLEMNNKSFEILSTTIWDLAADLGGIKMLNTSHNYLENLRKALTERSK